MTTDSRTNKYAAFLARQNHQRDSWRGVGLRCLCGKVFDLDADHALHQVDEILRAALVAAAGVAPQAESEHEYLLKARALHQTNSGLPSSTVDEAALIREAKAEALEEFAGQMATGFNPQTLNAERRAIKREARTRAAEYREGSER